MRSKVSADRTRFKDDHTNLDLSYITDNLIGKCCKFFVIISILNILFLSSAMGFPASGFEAAWRNHIDEVPPHHPMLKSKHLTVYFFRSPICLINIMVLRIL